MTPCKKYIICTCPGGLCNRLKCFVSCSRLSKKMNRKLLLYWPENKALNCRFDDLFENKISEVKLDFLKSLKKEEYDFYPENINKFKESKKKYIITDTWRFALFESDIVEKKAKLKNSLDNFSIDHENQDSPKLIKDELISEINKLKIKKSIIGKVNNFIKKKKLNNFVGVHIRRGDFVNNQGLDSVSQVSDFVEELEKEKYAGLKIFLATDSKEVEIEFVKIFGKRLILFDKNPVNRESKESIVESLIELIILSKSKIILGTFESTFSEFSWWLSKGKSKIKIIINQENLKKLEEKRKMENRMDKKIIFKIKRTILKLMKKAPLFYD
ncbi:MAG: alpha-1,2-fucosyltransferase [Candidatus ainarchaeum sp.]|nr:alpha-1,2-fucosyltransferase [Candidatus ainarchaeum sp.]